MAFGGGNSSNSLAAVLIVLVAAAAVSRTASAISLKARDHRCDKAEEGKTVTVLIQKVPVDCRCEKGIVTDCERPKSRGRTCDEELKVRANFREISCPQKLHQT